MEFLEMNFMALAFTSLLLGVVHGFDADHLVAVTNFVSKNPEPKKSAIFGFKFGLGHSITVLIFAIIALTFKITISPYFEEIMELMAGLLIIFLGIWVLKGAFKKRQAGHEHFHPYTGGGDQANSHSQKTKNLDSDGQEKSFNHEHVHYHPRGEMHVHSHIHRYGATVVGAITGLAGTAGVMLFGPVVLAESVLHAAFFVCLYGLGVIFSMSLYGIIAGRFYGFACKSERFAKIVMGVTGSASIMFGLIWVKGILLG